mmetsp:Transcript_44374/g.139121  ORF Transcript_44374/g.139121 Transcript_44374/m.139121 type:complete len:263 (-) Transcript_44374:102-890(-)
MVPPLRTRRPVGSAAPGRRRRAALRPSVGLLGVGALLQAAWSAAPAAALALALGLATGTGQVSVRHSPRHDLAPGRHRRALLLEGLLDNMYELRERVLELLHVAAQGRNVNTLRRTPQLQATRDELVDGDGAAQVDVQQLEDPPGLVYVEVQVAEVGYDPGVLHAALEVLEAEDAGVVQVHHLEQGPELCRVLGLVAKLLRNDLLLVQVGDVGGTDAEESGDDVQEGKQHEGDVDQENQHDGPVHPQEGLQGLAPADPTGHA